MLEEKTAQNLMLRREETVTANAQKSDFGFDFNDAVEEISGPPFGSSAQEVWSRIYQPGLTTGRAKIK